MNLRKIFTVLGASLALGGTLAAQDSALTITGSVRPRTQYSLADGTGYANFSSGPGGASYIRFADKLSAYSSLVVKIGTPYLDDKSGSAYDDSVAASNSWLSGVGVQEAYGSTDILGELGMNQLIGLKLQAGMFRLKAPMFSKGLNFGFGTGDEGSRAEVSGLYNFSYAGSSYESYKWSLEIPVNVLKEVFPLSIRVGSDLDLTGKYEKTGFTGYAEIGGRNLYLADDKFVVDWVVYYTLKSRDAAPTGTPYIQGANIFGGNFALGFGLDTGTSFGLGASLDDAFYSYKAQWAGTAVLRSYDESRLNWEAGLDVTQKDLFKVYGAMVHRNAFDLTVSSTAVPYDYAQDFAAFRLDIQAIKTLTPYFGGTYVLGNTVVKDPLVNRARGTAPGGDALSWETGLMWALTKNVQIDAGYTRGKNNALATFGAVLNAIEQSSGGAIFLRAGWKF